MSKTKENDMDIMSDWATKIAREVAPEEVDDAPFVVENYVRGGKARRDLFKQTRGGEVGGVGLPDPHTFFPVVIDAIKIAAPYIYTVLAAAGLVNHGIELGRNIKKAHEHIQQKLQKPGDQIQTPDPLPSSKPATSATPSADPAIAKTQAVESMKHTMQIAGLNQADSEQKSNIIINVFLQDPESAQQFVKKLTEMMQ